MQLHFLYKMLEEAIFDVRLGLKPYVSFTDDSLFTLRNFRFMNITAFHGSSISFNNIYSQPSISLYKIVMVLHDITSAHAPVVGIMSINSTGRWIWQQ
jgi:hypothetical protein